MRPNGIAVGLLVLVAIFAGIARLQIALLAIGLLVCADMAYGFRCAVHRQRQVHLPHGSRSGGNQPRSGARISVQMEGRRFELAAMPSALDLAITRRNSWVGASIALIAVGAVRASLLSLPTRHVDLANPRFFSFRHFCFLVAILLVPSFIRTGECTLMRTLGVTLAANYGHGAGRIGTKWLSYGFTDPTGGRHGSSFIVFGGSEGDDFKIVFCDPHNPSRNKLSCGLLFHRILWAEA